MAVPLLISPFPTTCPRFHRAFWRARTEQKVSHNTLTAQSQSWRSAQPLNQGRWAPSTSCTALECGSSFSASGTRERSRGQLLLEGKSWDSHMVGILEFHPAGLTSISWSLPVAFTRSFSAQ